MDFLDKLKQERVREKENVNMLKCKNVKNIPKYLQALASIDEL